MNPFSLFQKAPNVVAGVLAVIIVSFLGGYFLGSSSEVRAGLGISTNQPAAVDLAPFWKAWSLLDERFVPAKPEYEINDQEKVWGAIEGLASSYGDPYTVFLPPVENEIFNDDISGSFGGVGMEVGSRNGKVTVIAPLKDSPAASAGIKAGDIIVRVGDVVTETMGVDEAIKLIRGEVGTPVTFTIYREGESELREITVVRDVIKIPTIDTTLRDDGVFVISLYNFSAVSSNEFRLALREFIQADTDKLVLDLRGNPGGYLNAAVDMAGWFLPAGKVVVRENFGEGKEEILHRTRGQQVFNENLKMAILVNQGSASASEILAGALSEHGVAKLVGERTFGKGSVQELIPVTDDTSLKVTIARWLTPNGNSISDGGLTPDIEVKYTQEDLDAGKDPQLEAAAGYLNNL